MTKKLDPEFKRRWIADLRSDKYEQIHEKLGDCSNGRCCLGVAADLAMEMGLVPRLIVVQEDEARTYVDAEGYREAVTLPLSVSEALKIDGQDVLLKVDRGTLPAHIKLSAYDESLSYQGMYYASALNDAGMTFAEIADLIEEQL